MAAKLVIEPIFEADFCDTSYGFRLRRSAHEAIDDVAHTLNKGYSEVIDANISKYFDTIPHAKLMVMVAERICDGALLHLIQWHLEERMRTHLRKRHKVRDRRTGYIRFTNRDLYEKYGLYKVPTTAGWTKAHALR